MRRKWLLVAALLLFALGLALAFLFGLAPQPDRSMPTAPTEAPMSPSDRVGREESGIGTTRLPRVPAAADRP